MEHLELGVPIAVLANRKGLVVVAKEIGGEWRLFVYDKDEASKEGGRDPQPRFSSHGPEYFGTELKLREYLVEMKEAV